jgi:hypothetical protein
MLTRFTGMGNIGHHSKHDIEGPQLPVQADEVDVGDDDVEEVPAPGAIVEPTRDQGDRADLGDGDDDEGHDYEEGEREAGEDEEDEDEFDPEVGEEDDDIDDGVVRDGLDQGSS